MQRRIFGLLLGISTMLVLLLVASVRVNAMESSLHDNLGSKKLATTEAVITKTSNETNSSQFKQTACETHVKVINLRQNNIIDHATRVENRLSKLTEAVEKYYADKVVPAGSSVSNYDALVADITAKQTALTAALDKVKTDTEGLTCDKDQAKGQFATFRTDMQSLLKAFKSYRLSVLTFMQAVKKASGTVEQESASHSAMEAEH